MFNEIGEKIKATAKILLVFGVLASVLYALSFKSAVMNLIVIAVGCIASYFTSILWYGFGELIDNSKAIKEDLHIIRMQAPDAKFIPANDWTTGSPAIKEEEHTQFGVK